MTTQDTAAPAPGDVAPDTDGETTATAPLAEAAATQQGELPMRGTVLLGTITAEGSAYALVRSDRGQIARVGPGDRIGRQTVAAIAPGVLILVHNGTTERMVIPGS